MQDRSQTEELARLCIDAQDTFDRLAVEYRAAFRAAKAAEAVRALAAEALQASFDEVVTLAAAVRENGARVPVKLNEVKAWRAIDQGRERGEILAALDACAPKSMRG